MANLPIQPDLNSNAYVDVNGEELCLKFCHVRPGKCRFGASCHRSHGQPSAETAARINADRKERRRLADQRAAQRKIAAKAALQVPLPAWLHEHRSELVFACGTAPAFQQLLASICALLSSDDLGQLHTCSDLTNADVPQLPTLIHAFKHAGRKLPDSWKRAQRQQRKMLNQLENCALYQEYLSSYKAFVQHVAAPLCGDHTGVYFQCPPTLRIHMPGQAATIAVHCDADYEKHEGSEINFWVPLTKVWGSNTLYAESSPDQGDFRPFELAVGEGVRFNGNQCRHYTVPNKTGQTRVSFDFRVIPKSLYRNDYDGHIGDYGVEATNQVLELSSSPIEASDDVCMALAYYLRTCSSRMH